MTTLTREPQEVRYRAWNSRRYPRLQASYLVRIEDLEEPDLYMMANSKDVSTGGVKFTTGASLAVGKKVRVSVLVPPLERAVTAVGRILRRDPEPKGRFHYVTVQFMEMGSEDQKALGGFILRLLGTRESKFLFDEEEIVTRMASH